MPKYRVYGIIQASKDLGVVEADSKEAAESQVANDPSVDVLVSLCYQCANEVDLGEVYEFNAELIEDGED